jgi:putative serine protease PepD
MSRSTPSTRRPSTAVIIGGGVVIALVAGLIGGLIGAYSTTNGTNPSTGSGSSASVCSATQVSTMVLPSLVEISVTNGKSGSTGSGSVIDNSGHILTNNHVVELGDNGGKVTVDVSRGKSNLPATIVGRDPLTDVAVIKVGGDAGSLTPIAIGSSAGLAVGQPVVALGSPLGLTDTVTTGVVSALDRLVNVGSGKSPSVLVGAIQTDAAINPGNSGGPMVDCAGKQVGMNSAGVSLGSSGGGSIGLNFAIPMDVAMSLVNQIISTGSVTHPSIGIVGFSVTEEIAGTTNLPRGVYVESAIPGGPAAGAGIRSGDVITEVDGKAVQTLDEYLVTIAGKKVGEVVKITLSRSGSSQTVNVRLVEAATLNFTQ